MIGCGILPQPILILLFSYFFNINNFLFSMTFCVKILLHPLCKRLPAIHIIDHKQHTSGKYP